MYLLTAPTVEPVSSSEVKAALRIDDARFDELMPGLIASARAVAEQETGRQFVSQVWRIELAEWPLATDVFHVYRATAAAVMYWDGSAWQTLATNAYAYAPNSNGTSLAPAMLTSWPPLGEIAIGPRVRIDLTAGVANGSASTVPDGIKTFITALVGQMIQAPELTATAAAQSHPLLHRLLDPWRLMA